MRVEYLNYSLSWFFCSVVCSVKVTLDVSSLWTLASTALWSITKKGRRKKCTASTAGLLAKTQKSTFFRYVILDRL